MQDMARFKHRRIALYSDVRASVFEGKDQSPRVPNCAHIADLSIKGRYAFFAGMCTVRFFPTMAELSARFEPRGVQADWQKVGADLRTAFDREWELERSGGQ